MLCVETRCRSAPIAMPQNLLSFGEALVLADVRENAALVRKDIETGVLPTAHIVRRWSDARLGFPWNYVFVLAATYGEFVLGKELRRLTLERVSRVTDENFATWVYTAPHHSTPHNNVANAIACIDASMHCATRHCTTVEVGKFLAIDMNKVCIDVRPRIGTYAEGLNRIESKKGILGGEVVFKETRIPVRHIGGMVEAGETIDGIREDYPNLSEADVKFAHLYFLAHPPVGRPRKRVEDADDDIADVG